MATYQLNSPHRRSPLKFFLLVFALAIPFWVAGALTARQLLPALPVSALAFVCPGLAAVILVQREDGSAAVRKLLRRSFDFGRIERKAWLAPAILIEPAVMVLSYAVIRLSGVHIPIPQVSLPLALALCVVFFFAGLGEELGWSGT